METEQMAELAGGRMATGSSGTRRPVQVMSQERVVTELRKAEAENTRLKERLAFRDDQVRSMASENATLVAALRRVDSSWTPPPALPLQHVAAIEMVVGEYFRAKAKHGDKTMDGFGYTAHERLAILVEEAGEVSAEVLDAALQAMVGQVAHQLTYDANKDGLIKELVQVGAMALTWLGAELDSGQRPPITGPCFICGNLVDHYGVPHGQATGDGRTRADVQGLSQPQKADQADGGDQGQADLWREPTGRVKACCIRGLHEHPRPCPVHGQDVC